MVPPLLLPPPRNVPRRPPAEASSSTAPDNIHHGVDPCDQTRSMIRSGQTPFHIERDIHMIGSFDSTHASTNHVSQPPPRDRADLRVHSHSSLLLQGALQAERHFSVVFEGSPGSLTTSIRSIQRKENERRSKQAGRGDIVTSQEGGGIAPSSVLQAAPEAFCAESQR